MIYRIFIKSMSFVGQIQNMQGCDCVSHCSNLLGLMGFNWKASQKISEYFIFLDCLTLALPHWAKLWWHVFHHSLTAGNSYASLLSYSWLTYNSVLVRVLMLMHANVCQMSGFINHQSILKVEHFWLKLFHALIRNIFFNCYFVFK